MSEPAPRSPFLPPRWVIRLFWKAHRAWFRLTGGRRGLWPARPDRWGAMRVTTVGRRTGQQRPVILGYVEDGPNLVLLAMNGWQEGQPAWWLNLEAHPDAIVRLDGEGPRPVRAHLATGAERERLWQLWGAVEPQLDGYAGLRTVETPVIVLAPSDGTT